jgi:hypothetical protein
LTHRGHLSTVHSSTAEQHAITSQALKMADKKEQVAWVGLGNMGKVSVSPLFFIYPFPAHEVHSDHL